VVVSSLDGIGATNLIHSFTYLRPISLEHQNYFYVAADYRSTQVLSETEQYLSIVRALYPSSYSSQTLNHLKADRSAAVERLGPEATYVLYPGGSAANASKRWPHYAALMEKLGRERVMIVGGPGDLDYSFSYFYPAYLTAVLPQALINRRRLWMVLKKIGALVPHAHQRWLGDPPNVHIGRFSWSELAAVFKKCKLFIGNDGGLTHLAAAVGARGFVLFGPTSVNKNRPFNQGMTPLSTSYECQPCQFAVGKISMTKLFINCPYQVRCLYDLSADEVARKALAYVAGAPGR
jgi:ADP-heptose:LPS heptosyltransferase